MSSSRLRGGVVVAVVIAAVGCKGGASTGATDVGSDGQPSSSAPSGEPSPCSPLEPTDEPIALANVLGAGRHADGTIYVLDDGRPDYRAFVSQDGVLQRKIVAGTGSYGDDWIVATVRDPAAPFSLKIERSGGVAKRMGVLRGELQEKDFEIGVKGDVLEVVGADALAGLAVKNLSGSVLVEYDATTPDAHRLVVLRPEHDWTYEDWRVFYGTPDRMIERAVVSVSRGSSTYVSFTVEGVQNDAFFPSRLSGSTAGPAKLTAGGQVQTLTVLDRDAEAPGAGLTYLCIR